MIAFSVYSSITFALITLWRLRLVKLDLYPGGAFLRDLISVVIYSLASENASGRLILLSFTFLLNDYRISRKINRILIELQFSGVRLKRRFFIFSLFKVLRVISINLLHNSLVLDFELEFNKPC